MKTFYIKEEQLIYLKNMLEQLTQVKSILDNSKGYNMLIDIQTKQELATYPPMQNGE